MVYVVIKQILTQYMPPIHVLQQFSILTYCWWWHIASNIKEYTVCWHYQCYFCLQNIYHIVYTNNIVNSIHCDSSPVPQISWLTLFDSQYYNGCIDKKTNLDHDEKCWKWYSVAVCIQHLAFCPSPWKMSANTATQHFER